MKVDIDIHAQGAKSLLLKGIPNAVNRAQVRGINKTLSGVRTDKSAEIRGEYNLTKKYVDGHIYVTKASFKDPRGRVDTRSRPVGLIDFTGTRQTKKGVSVKVKKIGNRIILHHAFIRTIKNARNVFVREYKGKRAKPDPDVAYGRMPKAYRLPIRRLTGPRLTDHLGKPAVIKKIEEKAGARYAKNVDHELSRELERL